MLFFNEQDSQAVIEYEGNRVLLAGGMQFEPGTIISGRYAVVEGVILPRDSSSGPWLVTPAAGANGSVRLISTSRSGAAKIVLNKGGVRVTTERGGRQGG